MASAFGHALVAITMGKTFPIAIGTKKFTTLKFFLLGSFCATIPDADVLMNKFVAYESFFGHRGFFHSFLFCLFLAIIITSIFYRKEKLFSKTQLLFILFFFLCGASHGLLDMCTDGGRGVAVFSPFDDTRYFFPWRPIRVSPMSITRFFTGRGFTVIKSELVWIGIPCVAWLLALRFIRKRA